jgi:hypothetical protein
VSSATVLFLDIDGVLNSGAWVTAACAGQGAITRWSLDLARRCLDPARCERLQRVCDETGASLVIVSGWRRWATVEEIADALRGAGHDALVLLDLRATLAARRVTALAPRLIGFRYGALDLEPVTASSNDKTASVGRVVSFNNS